MQALDVEKEQNILDEFRFAIPQNPYLSPYYASDEVLNEFPPVKILVNIYYDFFNFISSEWRSCFL